MYLADILDMYICIHVYFTTSKCALTIYYENFQATQAYCESAIAVHCPYRMHGIHLHYSVPPRTSPVNFSSRYSSRILLNVPFQRKCSFVGDRAWWDIESVFLHSPCKHDKGIWACLGN